MHNFNHGDNAPHLIFRFYNHCHHVSTATGPWLIQELGHSTAEKQKPSPLQFLADFRSAIGIEKRLAKAGSTTNLKDLLGKVVAEYNKLCTVKSHRVDTNKRSLIYNMFLGS